MKLIFLKICVLGSVTISSLLYNSQEVENYYHTDHCCCMRQLIDEGYLEEALAYAHSLDEQYQSHALYQVSSCCLEHQNLERSLDVVLQMRSRSIQDAALAGIAAKYDAMALPNKALEVALLINSDKIRSHFIGQLEGYRERG